jgi:hypothetical protein
MERRLLALKPISDIFNPATSFAAMAAIMRETV